MSSEEFLPGELIGDYLVISKIGQGGMGVVYLAQHQYLKKRYAVKVLPREFSADETFTRVFQKEAQTLSNMDHSNIVKIYNFGVHEGCQYLVMDYVSGGDVEAYRKSVGGIMNPSEVAGVIHAILEGLAHAHKKGIIHRDLKPENFLLDSSGKVMITDFGISTMARTDTRAQSDTYFALARQEEESGPIYGGTDGYMAPEVMHGGSGDERSDIFAVGVIAYYLLSGIKPGSHHKPVHEAVPGLDAKWHSFIIKCTEYNQDERFQNVLEAQNALYEILRPSETSNISTPEKMHKSSLVPVSEKEKSRMHVPKTVTGEEYAEKQAAIASMQNKKRKVSIVLITTVVTTIIILVLMLSGLLVYQ